MAETQDTPRSNDSGPTDPLSQIRNDYKNLSNNDLVGWVSKRYFLEVRLFSGIRY